MKNSKKMTSKKLKEYGQLLFLLKFAFSFILLFLLALSISCVAFPYYIVLQLMIGALYVHMKELQHEALHGSTPSKCLDRFLGFLLGLPMLVSYSDYRYNHLYHHRYIGTIKDSEYFTYNEGKQDSYWKFILGLFMFEHYINIAKKFINAIFLNTMNISSLRTQRKIREEYITMFIIIIWISALSIYYKSFLAIKIWLAPLFLFCAPINYLIELPEHVFCEKKDTNIFCNTRTIKSNFFITWLVNGNNYHVEHHYAPNYPISFLSALHSELKLKLIHYNESYIEFYRYFFKKIKRVV
ncbi:MAG: fatty acid desaturase [Rickettsiaceae bacterium]|jgi:fatty acid desaturase|nr:fatty acid desaturase [Rickettsiaceae bacterium]